MSCTLNVSTHRARKHRIRMPETYTQFQKSWLDMWKTVGVEHKYWHEEIRKSVSIVIHKVPSGDGPYVRAKHAQKMMCFYFDDDDDDQLVEKDPETAIVWFWKAINSGDRVDSCAQRMAVVMKQLDRTEEAIEAVKSFPALCSRHAHANLSIMFSSTCTRVILRCSLQKCGKVDEQIVLLKHKPR
ncbi:UNVERIFIED_CONTAM: protein SULFUR DEFICIENCY-INDUCED 1 [Sesamum calycinum]|uniref:Protein SULFUR DEFICIENCY-INDUCED 1 n=1 Tax=Sesamum calycinum TaxID=2727403 RepID=A0AAW2JKC0_9LAMI